jgi:regulation of enolase protein 1 (concanavalin A-like superfamily)
MKAILCPQANRTHPLFLIGTLLLFIASNPIFAQTTPLPFSDSFQGKLQPGWTWVRENPKAWRVTEDGLEILVQPGNMWGPANNARNILRRPLPHPIRTPIEILAHFENRPTEQYEQVDLVWHCDDSHMVKIGQELVDGQLSIVMGREEMDRTRTLAIIPLKSFKVEVRLVVTPQNQITGYFRTPAMQDWQKAGSCDLPVKGKPHITIQCYQGPTKTEHWARINGFRIREIDGR